MLQAATNHPCVCVQVDTLLVETPCALEVEVVPASSRALAKGGQDLLQLRKEAGSTHREVCEPQKKDPCSRYLETIKYVHVHVCISIHVFPSSSQVRVQTVLHSADKWSRLINMQSRSRDRVELTTTL